MEQNPNISVYVPKTWNNHLEKSLPIPIKKIHSIKNHHRINDTFHLILSKNFWINELVLSIKTSKGIIAVTGCSHTGILNIARLTRCVMNQEIHALLGGFHLLRSLKSNINTVIRGLKNEKIDFIAPCHCTGDMALGLFKKEFDQKFLKNGVGSQHFFKV